MFINDHKLFNSFKINSLKVGVASLVWALPGQTDVADAVGHVAVTGERRVKCHRFCLLARWRQCPCRKRAPFRGDKLACNDVVRLCRFDPMSLKQTYSDNISPFKSLHLNNERNQKDGSSLGFDLSEGLYC